MFCLRILILKSSQEIGTLIIKSVWPVALVEFILILNNQAITEDLNVKLGVLKLLEVVLIKNPEIFYLHYWMFGVDGVGVEYAPMTDKDEDNVHTFPSPFQFVPFLSKIIKDRVKVNLNIVQNEYDQNQPTSLTRECVILENRIDSDDDLADVGKRLLNYISKTQGKVMQPIANLDEIIIEDFKKLNDFSLEKSERNY